MTGWSVTPSARIIFNNKVETTKRRSEPIKVDLHVMQQVTDAGNACKSQDGSSDVGERPSLGASRHNS